MKSKIFALLAVAQVCALTMALNGQVRSTQFKKTVQGIAEYDMASIIRAGSSGNRAYIPYLRDILTSTPAYRSPEEEEAVIALVKLGDKERSKELECDLLSNDPQTVDHLAGEVLPKIKGWFAIREYFFMLTQDAAYEKQLEKPEYHTDALFGATYPSHWAVRYLPAVVPRAPFARVKTFADPRIPRLARQWKIWIQRNEADLERLNPQGQKGLTFSTVGCTKKPS